MNEFYKMKKVELKRVDHNVKIGDKCDFKKPTIFEDCLFVENDSIVGFYLKDVSKYSEKSAKLLEISNNEFLSDNVPKSNMNRSTGEGTKIGVRQFSTILGSIQPRPHMRRPYPSISAVHQNKKAKVFVKAMIMLSYESEKIIEQIAPELLEKQKQAMKLVDDQWKFGNIFTSSISNFNINASFHIDHGNIKDTCNVIFTKRKWSKGGSLHLPDYNATIEQADNSMLVYPAWRNIHGVTPISPTREGGYRNSLIFYPLKAFLK